MGQLLCFLMITGGLLFILYAYKRQARELREKEREESKKKIRKKRK